MVRIRLTAVALAVIAAAISYPVDTKAQNLQQMPGTANDVAVGGGRVWVIGTDPQPPFGYGVYRWNGSDWDKIPGAAGERIAVDSSGNAWVINAQNGIYTFNGSAFYQVPGSAYDIGAGGGKVWVIGTIPEPPFGYAIYRWNGSNWDKMPGQAERIAVLSWSINGNSALSRQGAGQQRRSSVRESNPRH
jgi:hypothetical protein